MGTSPEEIESLCDSISNVELDTIINNMLIERSNIDIMYNEENDISIENVELSMSKDECAKLFGITKKVVDSHIEKCGINVYNKLINSYISNFDNIDTVFALSTADGNTTRDTGGSTSDSTVKELGLWDDMKIALHTGNILITKDSTSYNYRHGHIGVIQKHIGEVYYTDASSRQDPINQVWCRQIDFSDADEIESGISDYWENRVTLCAMYPNTVTSTQRESAGNQTYWYAYSDNYTYEALNKKTTASNSESRKLNCVGVAYRAYLYMTGQDILPDVSLNTIMLPSHIYYSNVMSYKTYNGSTRFKTSNFDSYDWGF